LARNKLIRANRITLLARFVKMRAKNSTESVSDAVRLFLRRVVIEQAFPLELKVPNAETLAAMEESRAMMAKRRAAWP